MTAIFGFASLLACASTAVGSGLATGSVADVDWVVKRASKAAMIDVMCFFQEKQK